MLLRLAISALLLLIALGCAASQRSGPVGVSRAHDDEDATAPPAPEAAADSGTDPLLGIDEPFHGQRSKDGQLFSDVGLLDELASFDLICVGEKHDVPEHHWAQLAVLYGLSTRARSSGRDLALGLEMIEHRYQQHLDRFSEEELSLLELTEKVEWKKRWGFDFALYRPLFEMARSKRLPVLGLNQELELTRAVADQGLRGLDRTSREKLPLHLDLHDEDHRQAFETAMSDHGGKRRNQYAAQVVRDETMAEQAADWLRQRQPARQLLVAAGIAHCRSFAIPSRVKRRLHDCRVVSVLPSRGEPSDDEAWGYDLVLRLGSEQ